MYNARDHLNCLPPVTYWSCYSAEPWCLLGVQEEQVSVPGSLVGDRLSHWLVQGRCPSFCSETAFQFHLNTKMHDRLRHLMVIPVVWYGTHPSVIIVIRSLDNLGSSANSASGGQWSCRNCLDSQTLGAQLAGSKHLRHLKTIQNHQWTQWVVYLTIQLCFMVSWPSTYSWPL